MSIFEEYEGIFRPVSIPVSSGGGGGDGGIWNFTTLNRPQRQTGGAQADMDAAYLGTTLEGLVTRGTFDGYQEIELTTSGLYWIEMAGAAGGASSYAPTGNGFGAYISGFVFLEKGQIITVIPGGQGGLETSSSSYAGGGGGGMSVIYIDGAMTDILMAAGSGGGSADTTISAIRHAVLTINGQAGSHGASGGVNGYGGAQGNYAGGGAGVFGPGFNATAYGGETISSGLVGGAAAGYGGGGGFGGGGGGYAGAGGGGGYSGGGAGGYSPGGNGGGGGSFMRTDVFDTNGVAGINTGEGYVNITTPAGGGSGPSISLPLRLALRL